jgi:hypothetical protein
MERRRVVQRNGSLEAVKGFLMAFPDPVDRPRPPRSGGFQLTPSSAGERAENTDIPRRRNPDRASPGPADWVLT